jgi:beta-phosphoglucomutase family hydrolase
MTQLGLPDQIEACLFDLDGVLTPTAKVHEAAWKQLFDEFLSHRSAPGKPFTDEDYEQYVDGRPRADGVRTFLASRGISLPDREVEELSVRKDTLFVGRLRRDGVQPFPGSLRYLRAVRDAGLRRAVVSASKHCVEVLRAAGIEDLLEERVDGVVAERERLPGKPAPDTYLAAAKRLGVAPQRAAVFEDALAGVDAGRAGGFGYVVGVDRTGEAAELRDHGADTVVEDLAGLLDGAA